MSDWVESGREPALTDMFDEPIVRILMESDRTSQEAIERLLSAAAKIAASDVPITLL